MDSVNDKYGPLNAVSAERQKRYAKVQECERRLAHEAVALVRSRRDVDASEPPMFGAKAHVTETDDTPSYHQLRVILDEVYAQASQGKGRERHAGNEDWTKQPWATTAKAVGPGFMLGQALKKVMESEGLHGEHKSAELLGAMHYIAMAIHYHRDHRAPDDVAEVPW